LLRTMPLDTTAREPVALTSFITITPAATYRGGKRFFSVGVENGFDHGLRATPLASSTVLNPVRLMDPTKPETPKNLRVLCESRQTLRLFSATW
jgi:hypothetical protein